MAGFSWHHIWHHKHKTLSEQAQQQAEQPRVMAVEPLWTKAFLRIAVLNLAANACNHMYSSTFPFYIRALGGNELVMGLAAGGLAICALIMRPIAGWFLDNISRRRLLFAGLALTLLISVLYLVAPVLGLVLVLRCVSGFAFASTSTSNNTIACDIVPKARFGEGISMFGLTNSLSMAVAPALGLLIIERMGFHPLFFINIGLPLFCILMARGLEFKPVGKQAGLPVKPLRLNNLFNKDALPASVVTFLGAIPYGAIATFVALYAQSQGIGSGGTYFMLIACGTASMRLFSGKIADKRGEGVVVYIGHLLMLASMLLLINPSSLTYHASGLCYGLGFGVTGPALQAMAVRIVPMEQRGSASSTFLCAFDIGIGLGGPIAGWLVTHTSYTSMFGCMAVFVIVAILSYTFWASKTPSAFKNAMRAQAQNK